MFCTGESTKWSIQSPRICKQSSSIVKWTKGLADSNRNDFCEVHEVGVSRLQAQEELELMGDGGEEESVEGEPGEPNEGHSSSGSERSGRNASCVKAASLWRLAREWWEITPSFERTRNEEQAK